MNREHLIQVAFSIDEDWIIKPMEDHLRKKLESEIEKRVKDKLYGDPWGLCSYYFWHYLYLCIGGEEVTL